MIRLNDFKPLNCWAASVTSIMIMWWLGWFTSLLSFRDVPVYVRNDIRQSVCVNVFLIVLQSIFIREYLASPVEGDCARITALRLATQRAKVEIIPRSGDAWQTSCFGIPYWQYGMDYRYMLTMPESEYELLNGLDVLVMNALRHNLIAHTKSTEALDNAKRIGAKETYFIHMSHHMGLHSEVETASPHVHLLMTEKLISVSWSCRF